MAEKHWYAVYTRGRHEKTVYADLQKRGIESFLPLRKAKHHWSDRIVTVEEPLFSSYVFMKINPQNISDVLMIRGVVYVVSSGGIPIKIDESSILSLQTLIREELTVDPYPYLREGDRVTISRGPLKGVRGYILRKNEKKFRLIISIDAIGASTSVSLDTHCVEKVF
jgi:transcription antitermination factor NusG